MFGGFAEHARTIVALSHGVDIHLIVGVIEVILYLLILLCLVYVRSSRCSSIVRIHILEGILVEVDGPVVLWRLLLIIETLVQLILQPVAKERLANLLRRKQFVNRACIMRLAKLELFEVLLRVHVVLMFAWNR